MGLGFIVADWIKGGSVHILDEIQARNARELRQQVEMAERRGHEKGLREGYSSCVLDQVDQKTQLTDHGGYFIGPVTVLGGESDES